MEANMPENEVNEVMDVNEFNEGDEGVMDDPNPNPEPIRNLPRMVQVEQGPGTLIAHVDTNKVTREELALIPAPEGTETFRPVAHIELVNSLEAVLISRRITIVKEQFSIRSDGSKLFGTFDLSLEGIGESCGALGFRTGNDRSMKLQMIAGMRVFVCDNMAFSGESIILNRKHTKGLDLLPELMSATTKYLSKYTKMRANILDLQATELTDGDAKATIHDVFVKGLMPMQYMKVVSQHYFNPPHAEFQARTAWSLHNAFSETAKDMGLNRRMEAMQEVGKVFGI